MVVAGVGLHVFNPLLVRNPSDRIRLPTSLKLVVLVWMETSLQFRVLLLRERLRGEGKLRRRDADEVVVREATVSEHVSWDQRHTARVSCLFRQFCFGALLRRLALLHRAADRAPAVRGHDVLRAHGKAHVASLWAHW